MVQAIGNFEDIKKLIQQDMRKAMEASRNEVEKELEENVLGYYDYGEPVLYQRTGTLLESPETSQVSGGGNHLEFKAEMNEGISYSTGTFSGSQVIEATETGAFGNTKGSHRYFEATRNAVPRIINAEFSKYFR